MKGRRLHGLTGLRGAVALGAGLTLVFGGTAAAGVPTGEDVGNAKPAAPKCSFAQGEWAHCVRVVTKLDHAPAVGGTAKISIDVTAQAALSDAHIEADLPGTLSWATAPEGLSVQHLDSAAPLPVGPLDRAQGSVALAPGATRHFEGTVRAKAAGAAPVDVRVSGTKRDGTDSGAARTFVTVGRTPSQSLLGYRAPAKGISDSTTVPAGITPRRATPELPYKKVELTKKDQISDASRHAADKSRSGAVHAGALTCFKGSYNYDFPAGTSHPSINLQVQLRAKHWYGDETLGTSITDSTGHYQVCSSDAGGEDDYIRFVAENGQWSVRNTDDDVYQFVSQTFTNVGDGTTTDVGFLQPADANLMPSLHIFDEANDAKSWTPGACWSAHDHDCRQIPYNWSPTSTKGTFYSTDDKHVYLTGPDPDSRSVVVHETGHAVMDDVYGDHFPAAPNCSPHYLTSTSSTGCAWTEGFADWYQSAVYHDPEYVDTHNKIYLDLENHTWGTANWQDGDTVEGRVAGALNDIADTGHEKYWDDYGEGAPGHIWDTLLAGFSATFHDFWNLRGQKGYNVSDPVQGSLYQNTIDYGFRNPLADNQTLTRPAPIPAQQNYHYATNVVFWSVTAVRPPAGGSLSLEMYGDRDQKQLLAKSADGQDVVDFVAVDSNHRPLGEIYPRVDTTGSNGEYRIQLSQGARQMQPSEAIAMTAPDNIVTVRDLCVPANTKATITATPSDPSQDAELFLMASDPAQSSTWVQPRAFAAAKAGGQGPGKAESFTYTAPAAGCYGVVLVNKEGSGTYTLALATS
ncbi:hypothetical protein [Streptomyces sp. NPDC052811]|uniref:hypothetical protein n=1 Tax=Streptomyces sp. NPDC052811 TaxID=3155731 RepID=UPI0034248C12